MNRKIRKSCIVVAIVLVLAFTGVKYTDLELWFENSTELWFQNRTEQTEGIHVVSNYPLIYESPWKDNLQQKDDINLMRERQLEVEEVLQKNIDNPLVQNIHLLVNQESAEKRLRNLTLGINKHKIIVKRINTMPRLRHFWSYINDTLLNRVVIVTNMDAYVGEGFEKVNKTFLVQENVFYAMTRSGRNEKRCNMSGRRGYCGFGYVGSHEAYLSVYTKPIPEQVLKELDFDMHLYNQEDIVLWTFKNRLAKRLLNPCKDLRIFHVHCVNIRGIRALKNIHLKWGKIQKIPPTGLYF